MADPDCFYLYDITAQLIFSETYTRVFDITSIRKLSNNLVHFTHAMKYLDYFYLHNLYHLFRLKYPIFLV